MKADRNYTFKQIIFQILFIVGVEDFAMEKKHCLVTVLAFIFITFFEIGIFIEILWHGWDGFGGVSLEYSSTGETGISFLISFIPIFMIAILFIRTILCINRRHRVKNLLQDCFCALFGIVLVIGIFFTAPGIVDNCLILIWGRQTAAFFIDYFNWMTLPF